MQIKFVLKARVKDVAFLKKDSPIDNLKHSINIVFCIFAVQNNKMARETELVFKINLDDQNMPEKIRWKATDGPQGDGDECKSVMVGMWDGNEKNTLRFDLWTKDMQVDEMHTHFFQLLLSLGETYHRATQNPFVQEDIKKFCMDLADKTRAWEEGKEMK